MGFYAARRWAGILFAWATFSAIQATFLFNVRRLFSKPLPWLQIARMSFTQYFLIWGIVITPAAVWLCTRYPIERTNWRRRTVLHLAASVCASMAISVLRLPFHHFVYPASAERADWMLFRSYFYSNGFDDITMYWFVVFICHAWMYYSRYNDRELRASQLEAMLTKSQLQLLKQQLHPHFLFNTLHSISELMHQNVTAADEMINRLSDLLRMTLENNGLQEVSLRKELEFIAAYAGIEQVRFGDRLNIVCDIEPETLDAQLPAMILQPLVENAIRYGIALHSGAGTIEVRSCRCADHLMLVLRNSTPANGSPDEIAGFGIGLRNTQNRLTQLYGGRQSLTFRKQAEIVELEIRIPFSTGTQTRVENVLTENGSARRTLQQVGP